jgi:5-methyltetrahydrofolate--homocysteine methyltransferase
MKQLFFDGAMGTALQERGLTGDPVRFNLTHGEVITDIHQKYLNAGADIITANTFGAYSHKHGDAAELIRSAMFHAKKAVNGTAKIALDISPQGQMLEPYGDMTYEEAYALFLQAVQTGAENGADLILIETFYCINELKAAIHAAKTTNLPVFATMTFDKKGRTSMGVHFRDMVTLSEETGVDALGMNCGFGPDVYKDLFPDLSALTKLPILIQPNAGLPEVINGFITYNVSPEGFAQTMAEINTMGCTYMGGCCGTTPEHIKTMIQVCKANR